MEILVAVVALARDVLVALSTGLVGLVAALAGASAAIIAVHFNARTETRRAERQRRLSSIQASRAWRDDIYEMQTSLARALQEGGRPSFDRLRRSRMGTSEGFLELVDDIDPRAWWKVARGRRDFVEVLEVRADSARWEPSSLRDFFNSLEEARQAIARIDDAWPSQAHRLSYIMQPLPAAGEGEERLPAAG